MPRSSHKAAHTHREAQEAFRRVLGPTKGDARYDRILNLRVDGVALGDRPIELRHETSNYYGREENEGLAIARVLVDLDLDGDVENIERRDKPDVCVHARGRAPLYVEHRFLDRGEIAFGRYCEEAANAFKEIAASRISHRNVIVNIDRGTAPLPDARELAREAAEFIALVEEREIVCRQPEAGFPLLLACCATITAKVFDHGLAVQFKPGPRWTSFEGIEAELTAAIERKRRTALAYPPEFRPLWLVVTVADESVLGPMLRPLADAALNSID